MMMVVGDVMPRVGMRFVRRVPGGVLVGAVFGVMMSVVLRVVVGHMVMGRVVALLVPPFMSTSLMPTVPLGHRRVQKGSAADGQIDRAKNQGQTDAGQSDSRHLAVPSLQRIYWIIARQFTVPELTPFRLTEQGAESRKIHPLTIPLCHHAVQTRQYKHVDFKRAISRMKSDSTLAHAADGPTGRSGSAKRRICLCSVLTHDHTSTVYEPASAIFWKTTGEIPRLFPEHRPDRRQFAVRADMIVRGSGPTDQTDSENDSQPAMATLKLFGAMSFATQTPRPCRVP
jgi:hypothetical protein